MLVIKQSSQYESQGVFTDIPIKEGELIGIWVSKQPIGRRLYQEGMKETWYESQVLGRYVNHSETPNTLIQLQEDALVLYSKGISKEEEIIANYLELQKLIGYVPIVNF